MDGSVQSALDRDIARLSEEEAALDERVRAMAEGFGGLKDIDLVLGLARTRLALCTLLLQRIARITDPASGQAERAAAAARARAALRLVEGLAAENVSEDQRDIVSKGPGFDAVKAGSPGVPPRGGRHPPGGAAGRREAQPHPLARGGRVDPEVHGRG